MSTSICCREAPTKHYFILLAKELWSLHNNFSSSHQPLSGQVLTPNIINMSLLQHMVKLIVCYDNKNIFVRKFWSLISHLILHYFYERVNYLIITRNKRQVYNKIENRAIGKRQLKCEPSKTWNSYRIYIKTTKTHSQFKTAFYEWKLDGYTSSTLNFAPNMF